MNISQMPKLALYLPTHFCLLLLPNFVYRAPLEQPEREVDPPEANGSGFSTGPSVFFHTLSFALELTCLTCKVTESPLKTVTMIHKTLPRGLFSSPSPLCPL